jgi:hypothetical protein
MAAGFFAYYFKLGLQNNSPVQNPEKLYKEHSFMLYASLCIILFVLLMFTHIRALYNLFTIEPSETVPLWTLHIGSSGITPVFAYWLYTWSRRISNRDLFRRSSRAQARTTVGREFPISALSIAEHGPRPVIAHVSCTLSTMPYGGFSPVRLQAEVSPLINPTRPVPGVRSSARSAYPPTSNGLLA